LLLESFELGKTGHCAQYDRMRAYADVVGWYAQGIRQWRLWKRRGSSADLAVVAEVAELVLTGVVMGCP